MSLRDPTIKNPLDRFQQPNRFARNQTLGRGLPPDPRRKEHRGSTLIPCPKCKIGELLYDSKLDAFKCYRCHAVWSRKE